MLIRQLDEREGLGCGSNMQTWQESKPQFEPRSGFLRLSCGNVKERASFGVEFGVDVFVNHL